MKSAIKSSLFSMGARSIFIPWFVNFAAHTWESVRFLFRRYDEWNWRYQDASIALGCSPNSAHINDVPLNFFMRTILENQYDFAIEIGGHSGDRSFRLAKLLPLTKVYALDVTQEYRTEQYINGVTIAPNNLDTIRQIVGRHHGRGILCSCGTLAYYPPDEFIKFMNDMADLKLDFAIAEPNTVGEGSLPHSIRRNKQSWYHPFLPTLWRLGYKMPDNGGQQPGDCIANYGDARTYIFAQRP